MIKQSAWGIQKWKVLKAPVKVERQYESKQRTGTQAGSSQMGLRLKKGKAKHLGSNDWKQLFSKRKQSGKWWCVRDLCSTLKEVKSLGLAHQSEGCGGLETVAWMSLLYFCGPTELFLLPAYATDPCRRSRADDVLQRKRRRISEVDLSVLGKLSNVLDIPSPWA